MGQQPQQKLLGLKIDIDTYRGTKEGVPALIALLKKHRAFATFYFSLGPDQTGRALKRIFRPGFFKKVSRTSVLKHYGLKTVLYGTILPSPYISKKCSKVMNEVAQNNFEVGIHTYNHIKWQDYVTNKNYDWTKKEMDLAAGEFALVFKEMSKTHAAAGWQINDHAIKIENSMKFDYCSDTRGKTPFLPIIEGKLINCPQIPTTLPTLDELIGVNGIDEKNVHDYILSLTEAKDSFASSPTASTSSTIQVYTLHAELEGMLFKEIFEKLLIGWKKQNYNLVSLKTIYNHLMTTNNKLPHNKITMGEISGRSGVVALQQQD
ncbi:MAG: 4-deoxy-4-formamido-L-arabinose-phosphoundecaprenol deformylase [Oligoflexia bacterium]|nr:4-deoxy-4-formamido-L-arabinose-phosphoundecaprenol deformylase [Oligoflexia bacterium]